MLIFRPASILMILGALLFSSCSPVQGYHGPPLPREEVALVSLRTCDSSIQTLRATTEGIQFYSSGITILPGERTFDLSADLAGRKYDCIKQSEFDDTAYDNCRDRRESAIQENSSNIPTCSRHDFYNEYYLCKQDFVQFICLISQEVHRGAEYSICASPFADGVQVLFSHRRSSVILGVEPCMRSSTETKRLRFSSPY